jgi:hypothetical protein
VLRGGGLHHRHGYFDRRRLDGAVATRGPGDASYFKALSKSQDWRIR